MNAIKTFLLMLLMTALVLFVGYATGRQQGLYYALIFALGMNVVSYWFSDRMVLAMYHAQPVTRDEAPELYGIVAELAQADNLPMPKVYIIPASHANAFATGRNPQHAAVAVTEGITRLLTREEMRAVLSHELSHVRNRDILTATVVAGLAGAIMMLSRWAMFFGGGRRERDNNPLGAIAVILAIIVAPLAAMLIQLAISRRREFAADEDGARLSHDPLALASALRKLETSAQNRPLDANPATAHLFIVKPFAGGVSSLFSTHPSTADRIARLEELARQGV